MAPSEHEKSLALVRTRTIERAQEHAIPIEFRSLSLHVTETHRTGPTNQAGGKNTVQNNEANYFASLDFHSLNLAQLNLRFNTNATIGLTQAVADRRLAENGPNALTTRRPNYFVKVFWYLVGGFAGVLWIGVITFLICWQPPLANPPNVTNLALAVLVFFVILLQASFTAFQDYSTARIMKSILDMIPAECTVLRDGQLSKIPASQLVVGDLVSLSLGNKVPADLRIISVSSDAKFDRAVLTGESEPVEGAVESTEPNFLEAKNIAFMGTMLIEGSCLGVVVLKGNDTLMGRINTLTSGRKEKKSILTLEVQRFVRLIVYMTIALVLFLVIFWATYVRPNFPEFMPVVLLLPTLMGCCIAFIPEGLPVCVSLTLLRIAKRMKENNILPKSLTTVETLGCVNVICSDKTGTLTENKMVVTNVAFLDMETTPEQAQVTIQGSLADDASLATPERILALSQLQVATLLCNNARYDPETIHLPIQQRKVLGDATDSALLRFSGLLSASTSNVLRSFDRTYEIPFNSKNKYHMTVYQGSAFNPKMIKSLFGTNMLAANTQSLSESIESKQPMLVLVKGAPDVLLPHCTSYVSSAANKSVPMTPADIDHLIKIQQSWARDGQRVLMICKSEFHGHAFLNASGSSSTAIQEVLTREGLYNLCVIGLVGICDPPRLEIKETISACRRAGVRFMMVTGDFGLTATAIAKNIGLFSCQREPDTYEHIMNPELKDFKSDLLPEYVAGVPQFRKDSALVLTGADIAKMSPGEWDQVCAYEEIVFARTSPEQKLKIVHEFQRHEGVVAVTGDGVNDAPALKAADVGIAVVSGSDVAIEAADLILMGEFSAIVPAIALARLCFENLQKAISYLLPAGSWSEVWPVVFQMCFGLPLSLSSFLMIVICCFTDTFPATALIMEVEEFDLLSLKPRNAKQAHLITSRIYLQSYALMGTMMTIYSNLMFYVYLYDYTGISFRTLFLSFGNIDFSNLHPGVSINDFNLKFLPVANSVTFVTLVVVQWANVLSVRNRIKSTITDDPFRPRRRNLYLFVGILFSLLTAVLVTEVPAIQTLMVTGSVPTKYWLLPLPCAFSILLVDEVRKVVARTFPKSFVAKLAW